MSTPPVVCPPGATLAEAAAAMREASIGSVVVTEAGKVVGILTERDLLRAAAGGAAPADEPVRLWMTEHPDVLGPDEEAGAAWSSLTHHHYRHLPVVEGDDLVGVVSLRDLLGLARLRPADESGVDVPRGLEGVVVAETTVGDVRGLEGFFHYRQYSAVDLAESRSFEDVWHLLYYGELPDAARRAEFGAEVAALRELPPGLASLLPALAGTGSPLDVLRTSVSLLGAELGWPATHDVDGGTLRDEALRLGAVVPTILAAAHRLREGREPVPPRRDLPYAANYLWMLRGEEPDPARARAVEQYLVLTIDHGFNSSTFTARVITSTGADLAAAICGAIGALSGPLHGGAPSRALDMLDAIGTPDRAEGWLREAVERGDRIMGFGHRVYKTDDPRALFLRDVARRLGGPLVDFAVEVERTTVEVLAELKPGRQLYTNVEFYAGVVLHTCGIPREMFTPTFAVSRNIGWCANVLEQASDNRLIRPTARYVGPPPPAPVPSP
ncbi:MAG TPA: citrate synthase [Acidimicrobiales bacterium]|nr:citrate synthase [Acidimicrobiales bacterium]